MAIFRLVLSGEDLARVRLLPHPDPVGEIANAVHRLRAHIGDPFLGPWSRQAVRDLGESAPAVVSVLDSDSFQYGDFGRTQGGRTADDLAELVRSTPAKAWIDEVANLADVGISSPLARRLADRQADAVERLAAALTLFHRAAVAPYWPRIQVVAAAESDRLVRSMARGGVDHLLGTLHPRIAWEPPVLTLDIGHWHPPGCVHRRISGTEPYTFAPGGRGLVLMPSIFAPEPTATVNEGDDEPAVVTFPVRADWYPTPERSSLDRSPLADLLGSTRAAVVEALADRAATTGGLARRLGISAATASEHASVLRAANLVTSERDGNRVVHRLTPLGLALSGGPAGRPPAG